MKRCQKIPIRVAAAPQSPQKANGFGGDSCCGATADESQLRVKSAFLTVGRSTSGNGLAQSLNEQTASAGAAGKPPGIHRCWLQLGIAVSRSSTAESLAQLSDILGLDCRRSISPRIAHICENVRNLGVIEIPTEGGHGGRGRRS